ncbi:MAG: zinc ribbon domain-containing protein [Chloroherpetonaceae bacterium]|nr:zinc ribbon domain-containing protein [Chloroherpetonaceae bacterium]
MPMYDYRCLACGYEAEIQQRITEPALTVCTSCGKETFQRVISAAGGFVLKGTGFYNTDYKNSSAKNGHSKSTESTKSDSSSEKTSSTPSAATV